MSALTNGGVGMTIKFYVRRGSKLVKLYEPGPEASKELVLDKICEYFTIVNPVCNLLSTKTKVYLVFEPVTSGPKQSSGGCFDILDQEHLLSIMERMGFDVGERNTAPVAKRVEYFSFEESDTGEADADSESLGEGGSEEVGGGGISEDEGEKVAVVGSRAYGKLRSVGRYIDTLPEGTIIVSGGAKGVDTAAELAAAKRGLRTKIFLPDYGTYGGKLAPIKRNEQIVDYCDRLVAFWNGKSLGTLNAITRARKAGKKVKVFRYPPRPKEES